MKSSIVRVFLAVSMLCGMAAAQQTTITGQVLDSQGASIASANVVAQSASGATYKTVSDKTGHFQIPGIPAAAYSVRAEAPGFGAEVPGWRRVVDMRQKQLQKL